MLVFLPLDGAGAGHERRDAQAHQAPATAHAQSSAAAPRMPSPALPVGLPRADATCARLPVGVSAAALRRLGVTPLPGTADPSSRPHPDDARESTSDLHRTVR